MDESLLSPELRSLLAVARQLPPNLAQQLADFAAFLAERYCITDALEASEEAETGSEDPVQRAVIRAEILKEPTAADHEIVRRVLVRIRGTCSRGPVKSVRLEMMHHDEIPGKPWGSYLPYASASGGNRWLPDGSMINHEAFARRRANGEFPDYQPPSDAANNI